jgi:putative MATE family efflux protein
MAVAGSQARFLEGSLFRHVTVMSLTSSVGLMAVFAVDFVNMIFISMLGRAELAAAIGYAGALLFFTTSFGIGMGIGVGALTARALGARDPGVARTRATNGLILGVLFGGVFAAVVWLFLSPLVTLLGATGRTHDLTVHYLQIVIPSQPLLMVGMIGGAILRSHGDAKRAMLATVLGALANAILDPILIFGLGWELTGAAISSVVARVVIAAVALLPIIRHHGGFDTPTLRSVTADLRPVFAIALPAILTQLATPVGTAIVTRTMAAYGEDAVAGMAITGRMTPVAFGVLFALSGAIGPIVGQNFGAGRMDRVRRAFLDGLIFTGLVTVLVSGVLFALREPVANLFRHRSDARDRVAVLRAAGARVLLQRGDLRLERRVQQPGATVLVDRRQLGPPHAWHDSLCAGGRGGLGCAGGAGGAGGRRRDLRTHCHVAGLPGHREPACRAASRDARRADRCPGRPIGPPGRFPSCQPRQCRATQKRSGSGESGGATTRAGAEGEAAPANSQAQGTVLASELWRDPGH